MTWAIAYRLTNRQWVLYPQMFESRRAAQFAKDNWPELLAHNYRKVVPVGAILPSAQRGPQPLQVTSIPKGLIA